MTDCRTWPDDVQQFLLRPIPPLPAMPDREGRRRIAIKDCDERLVRLNSLAPELIAVSPEYAKRGYKSASADAVARQRVAQMLVEAAKLLPRPLRLLIWDAWRPTALQQELFTEELGKRRRKHPSYSEEDLIRETQKYVSLPSTDPTTPAPHLTGGAIDLTVCDIDSQSIEMGTAFDDFSEKAATRYFEERDESRANDFIALRHRRLLYGVMTTVGFTAYREEWWHFDYGDQFWAHTLERDSIYAGRDEGR